MMYKFFHETWTWEARISSIPTRKIRQCCAAVTKYRSLSIDYAFCRVCNNNRVPANPNKYGTEITVSSFRTSVSSDPNNIINVKKGCRSTLFTEGKMIDQWVYVKSEAFNPPKRIPVLKLTGNFDASIHLTIERASKFYKMEFELMKFSLTISGQLGGFTKLDLVQVKSKYAREFNDISSKKKLEISRSVEVVSCIESNFIPNNE
ncbi:hypothetical protein F8M41_005929 [Gigaspora margarita]|uniref:Uncharacterized protein n=1 Tax=Gigaspora margarita TaxID=4874 RepID=A0A8H3X8M0_GIGMA|nr:hypothetical protein F8M41_005929 [Gigaspora margarita]